MWEEIVQKTRVEHRIGFTGVKTKCRERKCQLFVTSAWCLVASLSPKLTCRRLPPDDRLRESITLTVESDRAANYGRLIAWLNPPRGCRCHKKREKSVRNTCMDSILTASDNLINSSLRAHFLSPDFSLNKRELYDL